MSETVDRIMEVVNEGVFLNLQQIADRVGVTREYVRQIRVAKTIEGTWPIPWHISKCTKCDAEYDHYTGYGLLKRDLVEAGWLVVTHNTAYCRAYYCPSCRIDYESGKSRAYSWGDRWPREGTLVWRVLDWMESGKEYHTMRMSELFGCSPAKISTSKSKLIQRGRWRWEVVAKQGATRKITAPAEYGPAARCYPNKKTRSPSGD